MEIIFGQSQAGSPNDFGGDDGDYDQRVRSLIEDATDFEMSYLSGVREENQRYYHGLEPSLADDSPSDGPDDEPPPNRSTFVSTDVRDTILTVMPSLMRIFTSDANVVAEFVPNVEADQGMADQCKDYIDYVFFEDNEGFNVLHSVFKDALTVKYGITQWWTDNSYEVQEHGYTNLSAEQVNYLMSENPDAVVVSQGSWVEKDIDGVSTAVLTQLTLRHVQAKPRHYVEAVPPEEFRISRDAKSVESAGLVGRLRLVPVSDLAKLGISEEDLEDCMQSQTVFSDERYLRNPGLADDRLAEGVLYGEFYIRIDGDDDGVDELHYIRTIGSNYKRVHDEIVAHPKFALWSGDPRPHTAIGDCLADITKDVQRIKTNMMRGQLDNLAESIHPRTVVNETVTNLGDVLSDEVGNVIRTRTDPNSAVAFCRTPYAGAEVQESVNYLDQVRASRTGITEASKGLDPKAMQSTALVGIDAIVSGAQERIELIARLLAETGWKPTIKGLLREVVDNPCPERVIKLRGKWVEVNPSTFDPTMRIKVNPTLGKGTDMVRAQALAKIEQAQMMVIAKFGMNNPIVTPEEMRNTIVDQLELANVRNVSRYFRNVDPQLMQQLLSKPQEPSPEQLLAQAELEKVKKDVIIAAGRADNEKAKLALQQARVALELAQAVEDNDFRRDKLNIEASLEAAAIAKDITISGTVQAANQSPEGGVNDVERQ